MESPLYSGKTAVALVVAIVATILFESACSPPPEPPTPVAVTAESHEFVGTWNASGTRRGIRLGGARSSSIFDLKGSMILAGATRPGVGFLCETIAFVDSASGLVGRSVWTDEYGDQVFSELTGEGTAASNRLEGTIVGGTGRYTGATGTYEFSWQYVIEGEDGVIQGRSVNFRGRVQLGSPATGGQS
jgi:hypothetical protein